MQRHVYIIAFALALFGMTRQAHADCRVIDQLDKLYSLQLRLANNPDTGLFQSDIRQLRVIIATLSNRDAVSAVDGNAILGKGADVVKFLEETQTLLQIASMDDPLSVTPHFTAGRRANLHSVGGHLTALRCTDDQIAIAQARASETSTGGSSDAEDLEQVAATLTELAAEVFRPRSLLVLLASVIVISFLARVITRRMIMRRRRAKRHRTTYNTQYTTDERTTIGMLIDLNCLGTKLRHEKGSPLEPGTAVDLTIEDGTVSGTVMWSNLHYTGIQFRRQITLEQVAAILAAGDRNEPKVRMQNGAPKDAVL